jgi:predicted TIM-barrel fold metal-dependent hydrolase
MKLSLQPPLIVSNTNFIADASCLKIASLYGVSNAKFIQGWRYRMIDKLLLVSGDSHVNEPADLWYNNLPASMRDEAPRKIKPDGTGGWDLVLNGERRGWGVNAGAAAVEVAGIDPAERFKNMRDDGVSGEVIMPTTGMYVMAMNGIESRKAGCEVYNDFIWDQLGSKSPRFKCPTILPTNNVQNAIAELHRCAKKGHIGGAMIPLVGNPEYNDPQWEPLWSAIEEMGIPVVLHQGTGHHMTFYRNPGAAVANLLATQSMAPRAVGLLACSGVLERHPNLHFVFVETNAGWLAWAMQTLDFYNVGFKDYGWVKPELKNPPSFYIKRQIHATFQFDPIGIANIPVTGVAPLMWGSDFPHDEGTYPHSRKMVSELVGNLPFEQAYAIAGGTTMELFGFDAKELSKPV